MFKKIQQGFIRNRRECRYTVSKFIVFEEWLAIWLCTKCVDLFDLRVLKEVRIVKRMLQFLNSCLVIHNKKRKLLGLMPLDTVLHFYA